MEYRVGIVGCGGIARVHAQSLLRMDNVKMIAFADCKPERAQSFASEYGGNAYASLEEMLAAEHLDVLHICTPHALHVPMALQAAEKGIQVFTEKPAAVNDEQMDALMEAAKKVHVGVCFQNRYNDNVRYVQQALQKGEGGKVLGARAFVTWHREAPYYTESGWRGTMALEGGSVLINQSIHTLDLLTVLLGEAQTAEATMANHHLKGVIETEDTLEAWIQYKSGATACFYATNAYCGNAPVLIEIVCENRTYRLEGDKLYIKESTGEYQKVEFAAKEAFGKSYWGTGHLSCIRNFYASLDGSEEYLVKLEEAERTMRLMFQIYRSARNE